MNDKNDYFVTRGIKCSSFDLAVALALDGLRWSNDTPTVTQLSCNPNTDEYEPVCVMEWTGRHWFQHDD